MSWSADGNYLAVVKSDAVVIYRAGKFEVVVEHDLKDASDVAFSPTADTIALGSKKATVVAWNQIIPATPKRVAKPKERKAEVAAKPVVTPATSFIDSPEYQKAFKKVLSTLPSKSRIRELLPNWGATMKTAALSRTKVSREFDRSRSSDDVRKPNWKLSEEEALSILSTGGVAEFPPPPPDADWKDGYAHALALLSRSPYPACCRSSVRPTKSRRMALAAPLSWLCWARCVLMTLPKRSPRSSVNMDGHEFTVACFGNSNTFSRMVMCCCPISCCRLTKRYSATSWIRLQQL